MIKFIEYSYERFIKDVTRYDPKEYKESDIESAYKSSYEISSLGKVIVTKSKNTDGVIRWENKKGKERLMIQELKRDKYCKGSDLDLAKQLAQAFYYFFYDWKNKYGSAANVVGFVIATEKYIGWVLTNEIDGLLNELEPMYKTTKVASASHIKEDKTIINKIKDSLHTIIDLHLVKFNPDSKLTNTFNKFIK